jgi:hypothetical protein
MDPIHDPASTAQKPGFTSSELFLSIAGILAVVVPAALEVVPPGSLVAVILGVLGIVVPYVTNRTALKMHANKQAAMAVSAQQRPGLRVPMPKAGD